MNYAIDRGAPAPAYLQLYKQIKENIVNGAYPFGAKLPSKRLLAEEACASTITVEHAYGLLCEEGYAEARERSGYFVVFRAADGFAASSEGSALRSAASRAEKPVPKFPFSVLAKTMRRVLNDCGEAILKKSPNAGCFELREAISLYLTRNRGIRANARQIVIGSGAEYLYGLIVELMGKQRVYGIESPSYEKIEKVYRAYGAAYELLPLAADGIDGAALAATRADILHLTPYRSFPSGITASASKRHDYVRWSKKPGRFLVEDDFESEFSVSSKPAETLFSLSPYDNVIYVNTFSKTISPALRVGYMVLPEKLLGPFREILGFYSCTVPTFEQFVLAELISGGDFERHINRVRRAKRKELAGGN